MSHRLVLLDPTLTTVQAYPATQDDIERVYPGLQVGTHMTDASLTDWPRLELVRDTAPPATGFGEQAVEAAPGKANGEWHLVWTIQAISLAEAKSQLRGMARDVLRARVDDLTAVENQLLGELGRLELAQAAGVAVVQAQYPLIQSVAAKRGITFAQAATYIDGFRASWRNRAGQFAGPFLDVIDRIQSATTITQAHAIYLELDAVT